jgi:DNA-binding NtrC family response regulator
VRLPSVLICDDDQLFHMAAKHSLRGKFECRSAQNTDEAIVILKTHPVDVLLLDVQMRTPDEGLRFIPIVRELDRELAIIMTSAMTDFQTVRESMRLGAWDYVPKDFDPTNLHHTIALALEKRTLLQRAQQQNFENESIQRRHVLVGKSAEIQALRKTLGKIRGASLNVTITGETGTGKEVVARQLRKSLADGSLEPFVAVDSSTIQNSMAESILFGHEKGAFTGADRQMKGIFEEANGGIVYFDEIANMPLEIQSKLLRVLQEKEVTRLGSSRVIPLEFRVICASNRDLEAMAEAGQFKHDLLQRLNVIPLELAPLRSRTEDIPELLEHFVRVHTTGSRQVRFTDAAVEALQSYRWPGNVRELGNLVAFLLTMADGDEIDVADIPPKCRTKISRSEGLASGAGSYYVQVADFERSILSLSQAYSQSGGNMSKLAIKLGMDRSHLYTKLKEFGLHSTSPKKT